MDKKQNRYERDKSTPWIRRVFTWTIIVVFLMFCASVGFVGGTIYAFHDDLPSLAPLEDYNSAKWSLPTKVYSRDGQLIASFYEERRELVDIKNLPRELIQAVIAIEDSRFFQHNGVDFKGIARAAYKNFMAGRIVEGGSTLTQQLAKVLFFSPKQTFRRKIREALLAIKIERNYTKEQILDRYFNKVYFGEGAYGIETASQVYFGKSARNLNTAEAALLAALPKAPSYYSPLDNPKRARKRHRLVLKLMENKGMIEEGKAKKLFKKFWKSYSRQSHKLETRRKEQIRSAPYFSELIRKKLLNKYGADVVYRGGLTVRTTVNLDYQQHIQNQLYDYLLEFNKNKGNLSDTATKIPKDPDRALVEGSVAVKDPETGEMLAVVGGHEWHIKNQLNRAVQSHRQPGSAFKPILYAAALDSDYTISSSLQDRPLVFETPQGQWTPQNYSEEFHGRVTVHTALVNSLNVATIDLMQQIGPRKFIDYARKLGVESSLSPHMSLALGGVREGVTLEEIVGVYSVFANKGVRTDPVYIREVRDREGNLLERNFPFKREVINRQTAYLVTSLLQDVVSEGTGRTVGRYYDRPIAGKTGTTNRYRDAWFIGYTPNLVMGTWFGYDQNNRSLGDRMSGGVVAGQFWRQAARKILKDRPPKTFSVPPGITYKSIDPTTGYLSTPQCPDAQRLPFKTGTAPTRRCPIHTTRTAHQLN